MKSFLFATAACALLIGCAPLQQQRAKMDNDICDSVGANEPGDRAQCLAIIKADRDAKQAAAFNALTLTGLTMMATQPRQPVVPRTVECSTVPGSLGRSVSCW